MGLTETQERVDRDAGEFDKDSEEAFQYKTQRQRGFDRGTGSLTETLRVRQGERGGV